MINNDPTARQEVKRLLGFDAFNDNIATLDAIDLLATFDTAMQNNDFLALDLFNDYCDANLEVFDLQQSIATLNGDSERA
jgi:uncharacterized protein with ParB-like and HNH nuclease domain